jgi:hypothetical protein
MSEGGRSIALRTIEPNPCFDRRLASANFPKSLRYRVPNLAYCGFALLIAESDHPDPRPNDATS